MNDDEIVVIAGWQATHYHKIKWVKTKTGNRLSTICGRDSAVYDIHTAELSKLHQAYLKPCQVCFRIDERRTE